MTARFGRRTAAAFACATVVLAAGALSAAPSQAASSQAASARALHPVAFGAKLTRTTQPSNSFGPHPCSEDTGRPGACTRVELAAYGRAGTGPSYGGAFAPMNGTVHKIRIIAGDAGTFIPEIARVQLKPNLSQSRVKIVAKGRVLHYNGQGGQDNGVYTIETFSVSLPVRKGDFLAVQSAATSFERCSGGGANQLVYQPPLRTGGPFTKAPFHDGCFLLIEAQY